jgi:hypothetical protein
MVLRLSNARWLCTGDAWAMRVKADNRSDIVPDDSTRDRKAASELDDVRPAPDEAAYAAASLDKSWAACTERVSTVDSEGTVLATLGSDPSVLYH